VTSRNEGANVTQFLYGDTSLGSRPVATKDASGTTLYYYDPSGTLMGFSREGTVYYVGADQVGTSKTVLIGSGTVQRTIESDSWGNVLSDSNPSFNLLVQGFAGGIYDPVTKLVRFGVRDYDPAAGRWMARDSILLEGGINLYLYAENSPTNFCDPLGFWK